MTNVSDRRSILFKFSPGYSCWGDPANLDNVRALADTEIQHTVLKPPGVGGRQGCVELLRIAI